MRYQHSLHTITQKINHLLTNKPAKSVGLPPFCRLAPLVSACNNGQSQSGKGDSTAVKPKASGDSTDNAGGPTVIPMTPVDTALYNQKIKSLANGDTSGRWPARGVYPNA